MKKFYLLIVCLLYVNILLSQIPQSFSYQAILRGTNGQALTDKSVKIHLSFLSGSETGTTVYTEEHSVTTSNIGLITLEAGGGTVVSGAFGGINWSEGNIWLKVEIDENLTGTYTEMGCIKLLSVPYALYAASGNQGIPGVDGNGISGVVDNGDGTLTFSFTDGSSYTTPNLKGDKGEKGDPGTGLINKGSWLAGTTYNPGDYVFATNTAQTGNSMWIVQASTSFTSNTEPRLDLSNWVEFQAPQGEKGETGENGISIVWMGTFSGIPTSYSLNNAYYNSTDKKSYIYTASGWQQMTQDGIPINATTGQTLYYNGTEWIPTSSITNDGTNVGIGITPSQKLDVNGGTRLRGSLIDNSVSAGNANDLLTSTGTGIQWKSFSSSGIPTGIGVNGQVALWSGTNSLQGLSNLSWGTTSLQISSPTTAGIDDPILEVKNKDGKVVFGVYQGGVRIYVDDAQITKGTRGGFAIGGLTNQSKGQQEYFRITPDSARIYVKEVPTAKGTRGGFAIGGLTNQSKTIVNRNLMFVAPDSARFWVNETAAKGVRGGFAVGGLTNQSKGTSSSFLQLTPENYFIGHQSGSSMTSGLYNNYLGYQTGLLNTTGSSNSFIGYKAGYSNTSGSSNVFIGNQSGYTNSIGEYNTFLGYNAGFTNNASYNSFIGYQAGKANTSGQYNSFIGYNSGLANATGYKNVFFGFQSGASNTTGYSNVYIGTNAGFNNNGFANVAIGDSTASQMTSGNNNIVIGRKAGLSMTSGSWNVLIGESAGYSSTYANYNVMIGQNAGFNTLTSYNTYVGINAGYKINSGNNNVFLGTNAGAMLESGGGNTIIGIDAGRSGSWDPNIYHGYIAQQNVMVGNNAGYSFNSGDGNVFIGTGAGYYLEYGSHNVFIGNIAGGHTSIVGTPSNPINNKLYISNVGSIYPLIYGDFVTSELTINGSLNVTSSLSLAGTRKDLNWDAAYTNRLTSASGTAPLTLTLSSNTLSGSISDATTSTKGVVQLSNSYNGSSQTVATTEKALTDGLSTKVTGSGFTIGKVFVVSSGTILTANSSTFTLTWNSSTGRITLSNTNVSDYCYYWFKSQIGTTSSGDSNRVDPSNSIDISIVDSQGIELHFGDPSGASICSVWLQRIKDDLIGHYTKY